MGGRFAHWSLNGYLPLLINYNTMKNKITSLLFELNVPLNINENPLLLRIIVSQDATRIDFGYSATSRYIKGGWIRMSPEAYIQLDGSAKKYSLKEAEGITLAPDRINFKSTKDWQFFTLYFEPIPMKDAILNIIEEENPSPNDFNYYGIKLCMAEGVEFYDHD